MRCDACRLVEIAEADPVLRAALPVELAEIKAAVDERRMRRRSKRQPTGKPPGRPRFSPEEAAAAQERRRVYMRDLMRKKRLTR
jgi:hypothetical protein